MSPSALSGFHVNSGREREFSAAPVLHRSRGSASSLGISSLRWNGDFAPTPAMPTQATPTSATPTPTAEPPGRGKVTLCHKNFRTIGVSVKAQPAQMAHGDRVGRCDEPERPGRPSQTTVSGQAAVPTELPATGPTNAPSTTATVSPTATPTAAFERLRARPSVHGKPRRSRDR